MPGDRTLLTWIPGSTDGEREARNLAARAGRLVVLGAPGRLDRAALARAYNLIVVGHRSELGGVAFNSLSTLMGGSDCPWLVLAICEGGTAQSSGATLGENELVSPAQRFANTSGKTVTSTRRPLTFAEVGEGRAFVKGFTDILVPDMAFDHGALWKIVKKQDETDEITEMLERL